MVRALESLEGVIKAEASFPEKRAKVMFEPAKVRAEQMREALLRAGFLGSVLQEYNESETCRQPRQGLWAEPCAAGIRT